ncbi:hypothetical protein ONS95_006218 [Cadophora gregata]|uniref:uncharacterized protein n=1 Tax=Cadophora gregata TaxID=51156 RepID=UPI0026DB83A5|nr:uncharacterized protein ONS95_006218 [Cadophora gregata]KAK0102609.1 hypothetical protein ONS95_006218 [Cadophora gregata]
MARRKREKEAKLKSVSKLSRGQKRCLETVDIPLEPVTQDLTSTSVKPEDCEDEIVIVSPCKKSRHDMKACWRRSKTPTAGPLTRGLDVTPNTAPTTAGTEMPISQLHIGLSQADFDHGYVGQHQRQANGLPQLNHGRPLSPMIDSPSLFLSPRQSEQPENMENENSSHHSPDTAIKSELACSDVPCLEISNQQSGSFQQEAPNQMDQFYPPYITRNVPTPPISPTPVAQNDNSVVAVEKLSSSIKDLPLPVSPPSLNLSNPQTPVEYSSLKDPPNENSLQSISTITLQSPVSGTAAPVQQIAENDPKSPASESEKTSLRSAPKTVTQTLVESTTTAPYHQDKLSEKTKSARKVPAARSQQPPKQTSNKRESLPKVVAAKKQPTLQQSSDDTDSLTRQCCGIDQSVPLAGASDTLREVRVAVIPLVSEPSNEPDWSPRTTAPPQSTLHRILRETASPPTVPSSSMSNLLPCQPATSTQDHQVRSDTISSLPSITQRAPVAPMITTPTIIQSHDAEDLGSPKTIEQPTSKTPMFTIRGAANGPIASANQKSSDSLTQKPPSIEDTPTEPRYPKLAPKKRLSKADPVQPGCNRQLKPLPPFRKSSTEHYPQLTNLPIDATETAKRISALPIKRELRLRAKKRLVGLNRGDASLEATLG